MIHLTQEKNLEKIIVFIAETRVKRSPALKRSDYGGGAAEPRGPDEKPVQLARGFPLASAGNGSGPGLMPR